MSDASCRHSARWQLQRRLAGQPQTDRHQRAAEVPAQRHVAAACVVRGVELPADVLGVLLAPARAGSLQTEPAGEGTRAPDDEPDAIDRRIAEWRPILGDVDEVTEGIVQRIDVLAKRLKKSMVDTLAELGLKHEEWSVIGILRKAGEPYRVSAGHLAQRAEISSGAMTNRLDRLEANGHVRRVPDPADRRGVLVELTPKGLDAWLSTIHIQGGKERLITAVLDDAEREQLHRLLRRLTREMAPSC